MYTYYSQVDTWSNNSLLSHRSVIEGCTNEPLRKECASRMAWKWKVAVSSVTKPTFVLHKIWSYVPIQSFIQPTCAYIWWCIRSRLKHLHQNPEQDFRVEWRSEGAEWCTLVFNLARLSKTNKNNNLSASAVRMSVLWSKEDDIRLWALRTKPTSQVSMCLRSIFAFCSSSDERRFIKVHSEYF